MPRIKGSPMTTTETNARPTSGFGASADPGPEGQACKTGAPSRDNWFLRHRSLLLAMLSLAIFATIAMAGYKLTHEIRYEDVVLALRDVRPAHILLAVSLTGLSFLLLAGYDATALHHLSRPQSFSRVAVISFAAYAIGNTAGFGPLSGGAVRYRGYSRLGLGADQIAGVIAFVTLAFGLGLTVATAVAGLFLAERVAGLAGTSPLALRLGAGVLLVALVGLWFALRKRGGIGPLRLPSGRICLLQLAITVAEICVASSVLYVLLPAGLDVPWPVFVAIYAMAIGLGVLSHVPAGLGVFDAVILTTVGRGDMTEAVLGALLLYRVVYHVLPLVIAVLVLAWFELLEAWHSPGLAWAQRIAGNLAPPLVAALSFLCGAMLIFSGVIPTPVVDLEWLGSLLPLQLIEAAHFLSSLLGLGLVVAARGLTQRLDGAFWLALLAAVAALCFAFIKAIAPFQAVMLTVLILALLISRPAFNRRALLFTRMMSPGWIAALAMILVSAATILMFVYRDLDYSHDLWWRFELSSEAPRGLRALLGLVIALSILALHTLIRPVRHQPHPATAAEIAQAVAILARQDNSEANLVRMGDKSLMFSENGDGFVMYGVQGRSWISLFGPIGTREAQAELTWRFVESARDAGGRAVFYQAPPDLLALCADAGLRALKLGEKALVDLRDFDLATSRRADQRQTLRRGARDGMTVTVIDPPQVATVIDDLARISEGWLAHHQAREKGFALGKFDRDYVLQQPVAVLRINGEIMAFASLMETATKVEASIDLMRFAPEAPRRAMDFIFSSLLVEYQARGFQRFNLGMAPMSGLTEFRGAPIWNSIGQAVFEHGEKYYNFKGLRVFKSKFSPDWEPRYLVTGGGISPVAALLDATLLIGGGLKGVVRK